MADEITLDRKELLMLVQLLFAYSVESRAQSLLRLQQPRNKRGVVAKYVEAVKSLMPQAKKDQKPHYRALLKGLKASPPSPDALAIFLAREAKSPSASDTKVRETQ